MMASLLILGQLILLLTETLNLHRFHIWQFQPPEWEEAVGVDIQVFHLRHIQGSSHFWTELHEDEEQ